MSFAWHQASDCSLSDGSHTARCVSTCLTPSDALSHAMQLPGYLRGLAQQGAEHMNAVPFMSSTCCCKSMNLKAGSWLLTELTEDDWHADCTTLNKVVPLGLYT